jgi:hypothetical protein
MMEHWFIDSEANITRNDSERGQRHSQSIVSKESETSHCTVEISSLAHEFIHGYDVFECCLVSRKFLCSNLCE